jgi:hypothetical protein
LHPQDADDENGEEKGSVPWEYSDKALLLIKGYQEAFPQLFEQLKRRPDEQWYQASTLLGPGHVDELKRILEWLAQLETTFMPRVPLTTQALPRDAIRCIERAADEMGTRKKKFGNRVQVRWGAWSASRGRLMTGCCILQPCIPR